MRLIYTDEAGSSDREPVLVIAAIIVDGDRQIRHLENEIDRIVEDLVPEDLRTGFHIHAKDIFHGSRGISREIWGLDERLDFLKEIGCLPFVNDIPIAISMDFKQANWNEVLGKDSLKEISMNSNQYTHLLNFGICMDRADLFLRKYLKGRENGLVIAEDEPVMKRHLSRYGLSLRDGPITIDGKTLRLEKWQKVFDHKMDDVVHRIDHILETPHFVKKSECKLIQLADVIAFSFRRCLEKRSHGADLVNSILGPSAGPAFVNDPAWFSVQSSGLFNTDSYIDEEVRRIIEIQRMISASQIVGNLPES